MRLFCTTNASNFPPKTVNLQFDEKWAFVYKKEKHCNNDEVFYGDNWDHVGYDPDHKLVLAVVPGKRCPANIDKVVEETKRRTAGKFMDMITTDEYKGYKPAILKHYGVPKEPTVQNNKVGRPRKPVLVAPEGLNYGVVHKTREKGRVVKTEFKVIFGNTDKLERSGSSRAINTAFIERYNGTDRNQNARKVRRTYMFSKDWATHNLLTYFICYSYNFCWAVRTLTIKPKGAKHIQRTPAMAAKLTDRVWKIRDWLTIPVVQLN